MKLKRLNFLSQLKKHEKLNHQSLQQTMIERKSFGTNRRWNFSNGYWIISLFESVPMDKVKTNSFYV